MTEQQVRSEVQQHANLASQPVFILRRGNNWKSSTIKHQGWSNEGTVFPELSPEQYVGEDEEESSERVIYEGKFYDMFMLMVELENAFNKAKASRFVETSEPLYESEVSFSGIEDTVEMIEETLTDGSKVYSLRLS